MDENWLYILGEIHWNWVISTIASLANSMFFVHSGTLKLVLRILSSFTYFKYNTGCLKLDVIFMNHYLWTIQSDIYFISWLSDILFFLCFIVYELVVTWPFDHLTLESLRWLPCNEFMLWLCDAMNLFMVVIRFDFNPKPSQNQAT